MARVWNFERRFFQFFIVKLISVIITIDADGPVLFAMENGYHLHLAKDCTSHLVK